MAFERALTQSEAQRMSAWLRLALKYVAQTRLQAILKHETSLIGESNTHGLKGLVNAPERVANKLLTGLQSRFTQDRACVVLHKIVRAAWDSRTLNRRSQWRLKQSSNAMRAGNWDQVRRLAKLLDQLNADPSTAHPMLDYHQPMLMLESGSPERVFAALEWTPVGDRDELERDRHGLGSEGTGDDAGSEQSTTPVPAMLVRPSRGIQGAMPPRSSENTASESLAEAEAAVAIVPIVDALFGEVQQLRTIVHGPALTAENVDDLLDPLREMGRLEVDADADASDVSVLLVNLQNECARQLTLLNQRQTDADARRAAATDTLHRLLGSASIEALVHRWDELKGRAGELPEDRFSDISVGLAQQQLPTILDEIDAQCEAWAAEQKQLAETEAALRVIAQMQGISVEDARERMAGPTRRSSPPPRPQAAAATLQVLKFPAGHPMPRRFPRSGIFSALSKEGDPQAAILPLAPGAGLASPSASTEVQATAAAASLVAITYQHVTATTIATSAMADLLLDVEELSAGRYTPAGQALAKTVLALLLVSATSLRRSRAGKRLLSELMNARDPGAVDAAALKIVEKIAGAPGTPIVFSAALRTGLASMLIDYCRSLQEQSLLKGRLLGEDLAIAASTFEDEELLRKRCFRAESLEDAAFERVEAWLAGFGVRRRRPQPALDAELPAWLTGYVTRLAHCIYETETDGRAVLNASVPRQVQQHGIFAEVGEEHIVLPVLIRNAGKAAAAGVELSVAKVEGAKIAPDDQVHHVAWLARDGLEAPQDAVIEVPVTLDDGPPGRFVLHCELRSNTGEISKPRALAYMITSKPPPVSTTGIPGLKGAPMDLLETSILERSSKTVRDLYRDLRDRLRNGEPVRRMVYGRRRRGKSSIRSTLKHDKLISRHFLIGSSAWNAARMTKVEDAFKELGYTLVEALNQRNVNARPFVPERLGEREALYRAWKRWLSDTANLLQEPVKVLLLIDEFQKWLAALGDRADRQTVLNAFRDFNDDAVGDKLTVGFVLFGLRSLKRISHETNDFGNAVKAEEVKALRLDEANRYIQETLPVDSDGRARQRLARLSGGNPFVLNLLTAELTRRVTQGRRPYALVTDVVGLLDDMSSLDSRLDSFFGYMLKEEEDESAPTLRQSTVLKTVASILDETGDYSGFVRCEDVEEWLSKRGVPFDPGLPATQLSELADSGVLERYGNGEHYGLRGEAMCRWLASQTRATASLLPVTRIPDAEMVLNRYRIVRELDQGGQNARIYVADDTTLAGRQVVLKIYHGSNLNLRRRVEREASFLSRAQGRYVVPFHEWGVDERKGGILVMKWIDGRTLAEMIESPDKSAAPILPGGNRTSQVQFMKKLAEGVDSVHGAGVVHKDLSAKNVMLVEEAAIWEPRLIDFGISGEVVADGDIPLGETTDLGTARYMAPEKLTRGQARTRAADVYSLGVIFLDLSSHREAAQSVAEQLESSDLPSGLSDLITSMLSEDPGDRPTAQFVRTRLDGVLDPNTWEELKESACNAYCNDEFEDAIYLYRRAVSEFPATNYPSPEFRELLLDSLATIQELPEKMDWWDSLFAATMACASYGEVPFPWVRLMDALAKAQGGTTAGIAVYDPLVGRLERMQPDPAFRDLLKVLCGVRLIADSDRYADRVYYLLIDYSQVSMMPEREAANFCAARARALRQYGHPVTSIDLWLRRGRRVCPSLTDTLNSEIHEAELVRAQTSTLQTLPVDSPRFDIVLGNNENGHDNAAKIRTFAEKIRDGHPYVAAVHRIRKDPHSTVSLPTLDRLDSAVAKLRGIDQDRVISFVLDASYTRSSRGRDPVPVRLAIVLSKGTSASQRHAAYDRLADDRVLFPK